MPNATPLRTWYFLLVIFWCPALAQQQALVDSLEQHIQELSGTDRVDALVEYGHAIRSRDLAKSREAVKEAQQLAEELHYEKGQAAVLLLEGVNEYSSFNNARVRQLLKESISISHRINAKDLEGYAMAYLGLNYQTSDQPDSALQAYKSALPLLTAAGNSFYLSFLYLALSDYYALIGDPVLQFDYLQRCWVIREKDGPNSYLPFIGVRMSSYYVNAGEYEKARYYLDRSIEALGNDTLDNENIALIDQHYAILLANEGKILSALRLSNRARRFYEENGYTLELTQLLIQRGDVFEEISNSEAGLKDYFAALKIAEENGFTIEIIKVEIGAAWIYYDLHDYATARKYAEKANETARLKQYPKEVASAENLMGLIALEEGNYADAAKYLRLALARRQRINDKQGVAGTLSNLGLLFEQEHQIDSAISYEQRSRTIEEKTGHVLGAAYSYQRLGALYLKAHRYQEAEKFLLEAESLARKIKSGSLLVDVLENRRDLLKAQGKLSESLNYSLLYEHFKDSIFSVTLGNRIASLENANQVEQKDKEIQLLNRSRQLQENQLLVQQTQIEQQWTLTIAIIVALLLSSVFSFLLFRNNRQIKKLNERLSMQYDQAEKQNAALEEARNIIADQNREILLRNESLEEEVAKRTRVLVEYNQQLEQFAFIASHNLRGPVARVLGLGQVLALKNQSEHDKVMVTEKLIQTVHEIDRVVLDMGTILEIKNHGSAYITETNVQDEWQQVCRSLEKEIESSQAEISVDFSAAPVIRTVRSYLSSMLYNLLSNAIKYRQPEHRLRVRVRTSCDNGTCQIIVSDNGLGIDLSRYGDKMFTIHSRFHDHVEGRGIGLYLMKSQMDALGGGIEVESKVGVGSTFTLRFVNNT